MQENLCENRSRASGQSDRTQNRQVTRMQDISDKSGILFVMARGWESKSVEDQIGDAQAEKEAQAKRQTSPREREQQGRRESLLLSRAQILSRLKLAQNPRYHAQLESALKHVEAQLRECESAVKKR